MSKHFTLLFEKYENYIETKEKPQCIDDIFLYQIFKYIIKDKNKYNLLPFFYTTLNSINDIYYRQEIFKDIENTDLIESIIEFSYKIEQVINYVEYYKNIYFLELSIQSFHLEAILLYIEAIEFLKEKISSLATFIKSKGLLRLKNFLEEYINSEFFIYIKKESNTIKALMQEIEYTIKINKNKVTIRKYSNEQNFNIEIKQIFKRFEKKTTKKNEFNFNNKIGANHIQEQILLKLSRLFPQPFKKLKIFFNNTQNFINNNILQINRELQFYISYLQFINKIKGKKLNFCYPELSDTDKEEEAHDIFDITLALNFMDKQYKIITNDYFLKNPERIIVVTGPNQGGKTTFARTFAQIHYLAKLGLPVAGSRMKLFNPDNIYTHFEKEETIKNQQGKLKSDLLRMKNILDKSTSKSIIIINEIFNSTTSKDALLLGQHILNKILELDAISVYVTFISELSCINNRIVSYVSSINKDNLYLRTFKIERKKADKNAYAIYIAKKYNLTYQQIKKRIKENKTIET